LGDQSIVSGRSSFVFGKWELQASRMTLEELENTLPNGLHDAEVKRIVVDYTERSVVLDVDVWVGDMRDAPARREAYRRGRIEISGLLFLVMEPPDKNYPFKEGDLRIDGCDLRKNLDKTLLESLPNEAFFRSLWVSEWNAFIHIAAGHAQVNWNSEVVYRRLSEQGHPRRHIAPGQMIEP
jgi:hypothetical protein